MTDWTDLSLLLITLCYLYFNEYVYVPEKMALGACLFWCTQSEPPWKREALRKTGLMPFEEHFWMGWIGTNRNNRDFIPRRKLPQRSMKKTGNHQNLQKKRTFPMDPERNFTWQLMLDP